MTTTGPTPRRYLIMMVLGALALLAAACGTGNESQSDRRATSNTQVDLAIPEITIAAYQGEAEIGGREVALSEVLSQGKPVVLNFWAALCPPCRAEMPEFQRVYEQRGKEVIVLGIDVGPQLSLGSREQGLDLLRELQITFPAGTTFDENIARAQGILGMPTTMFIHADGRLMRTWTGLLNEAKMHELIDELLQG